MAATNTTQATQAQEIPFEEIVETPVTDTPAPAPAETTASVASEKEKASAKKAKVIKKNVRQKLLAIQTVLKAPKNLYNSYGGYNYRNAEGILEAVKPYLAEQECILVLEDEIETRGTETVTAVENGITKTRTGERLYVKATAHFVDCETGEEITTTAYANECAHKGMSGDQCTGTASSYARKYCLNALLLLDDTKDSDTDEIKNIENAAAQQQQRTQTQAQTQQNAPKQPVQRTQQGTQQGSWGNNNSNPKPAGNPKPTGSASSWGKPAAPAQQPKSSWGNK